MTREMPLASICQSVLWENGGREKVSVGGVERASLLKIPTIYTTPAYDLDV